MITIGVTLRHDPALETELKRELDDIDDGETLPSGDRTLVHEDPDAGAWYDDPGLTEGPVDKDSTNPLMVLQETVVETGNDETRKSRRSVERALSDLHETDDAPKIAEVHVATETERGSVDIETGGLVEDAEIVADFTD